MFKWPTLVVLIFVVCSGAIGTVGTRAAAQESASDAAALEGFRSAKFGMDQDAVRAAIKDDFGAEGDRVASGRNTIERTNVLTLLVPDLLSEGGTAQVSYVFGYTTDTLIQVGVSWSAETDPALTDEDFLSNGEVLRAFFVGAGYDPDTVIVDSPVENGIILFRGSDLTGRTALLLLQGAFIETAEGQPPALLPSGLALLYSVSPDNPDVFQIEEGEF
ncbi:MAG: hypothetical protein AAGK37_11955 [Pseudomonadota bacterium]